MAEVLRTFEEQFVDRTGGVYTVHVVGAVAADDRWEGWLEFIPADAPDEPVITEAESRQPKRSDLVYWATGLTPVYVQGAFDRARRRVVRSDAVAATPASHAPAPHVRRRPTPPAAEAVLDPFDIGARSLDILRQELTALNRPRLMNIIAAYELNPAGEDLTTMTDNQLVHFIVTAVDLRLEEDGL
jgi:hypothetical protein